MHICKIYMFLSVFFSSGFHITSMYVKCMVFPYYYKNILSVYCDVSNLGRAASCLSIFGYYRMVGWSQTWLLNNNMVSQ